MTEPCAYCGLCDDDGSREPHTQCVETHGEIRRRPGNLDAVARDFMNDTKLKKCSLATRGFFADVLFLMNTQAPRGVLPEGLKTFLHHEYSKCLCRTIPFEKVYPLMMEECDPLMDELLRNGVCHCGKGVEELPAESIVYLPMFWRWSKSEARAERNRKTKGAGVSVVVNARIDGGGCCRCRAGNGGA